MRLHDPKNPYVKGLPRPIGLAPTEEHPDRKLPVPWSQAIDDEDSPTPGIPAWGIIHDKHASAAGAESLCLVCGEQVIDGVVFFGFKPRALGSTDGRGLPYVFSLSHCQTFAWSSGGTGVLDSAPLHVRCAKLTAAHCQHIKDEMKSGTCRVLPYRQLPLDKPAPAA